MNTRLHPLISKNPRSRVPNYDVLCLLERRSLLSLAQNPKNQTKAASHTSHTDTVSKVGYCHQSVFLPCSSSISRIRDVIMVRHGNASLHIWTYADTRAAPVDTAVGAGRSTAKEPCQPTFLPYEVTSILNLRVSHVQAYETLSAPPRACCAFNPRQDWPSLQPAQAALQHLPYPISI